jgi:hypothetical protein
MSDQRSIIVENMTLADNRLIKTLQNIRKFISPLAVLHQLLFRTEMSVCQPMFCSLFLQHFPVRLDLVLIVLSHLLHLLLG